MKAFSPGVRKIEFEGRDSTNPPVFNCSDHRRVARFLWDTANLISFPGSCTTRPHAPRPADRPVRNRGDVRPGCQDIPFLRIMPRQRTITFALRGVQ